MYESIVKTAEKVLSMVLIKGFNNRTNVNLDNLYIVFDVSTIGAKNFTANSYVHCNGFCVE